ncbi:MAG: TylF/MycF/NovP-related O-methyltransferase [Alphaproteobacteria bacterium]
MKLVDSRAVARDFYFEMQKHSLHLRPEWTARQLAVYELYKMTLELPGSIAEFGVRNGANFFYLARMMEIFHAAQRHDAISARQLYGFDTFRGFPSIAPQDRSHSSWSEMREGGVACFDREVFFRDLEEFRSASAVGRRLHVVEGDVVETLPAFLESNPGVRFALIYLDMDLYEPTKACLELLAPKLVPGAVVVFDEYGLKEFPGETAAADEFLARHKLGVKHFPWCFSPSAYTIFG